MLFCPHVVATRKGATNMKSNPWTKNQTFLLLCFHTQGFSNKWIAELLCRTEIAVRRKLHDLGFSSKAGRKPQILDGAIQPPTPMVMPVERSQQKPLAPAAFQSSTSSVADTIVEEDKARRRQLLLAEEAKKSVQKYEQAMKQRAVEDRIVGIFTKHSEEKEDTLFVADHFTFGAWTLHQALTIIASVVSVLNVHCVEGSHGRWPHQRKMPSTNRYSNLDHLVNSSLHQAMLSAGDGGEEGGC